MPASAHTYYLPQRDGFFGTFATTTELTEALRSLWTTKRLQKNQETADDPSSATDGVSVWISDDGAVQLRFIYRAAVEKLTNEACAGTPPQNDDEACARLLQAVKAQIASETPTKTDAP